MIHKLLIILIISVSLLISGCSINNVDCNKKCKLMGYEEGECKWPKEVGKMPIYSKSKITSDCWIPNSMHCGNKGQCICHCYTLAYFKDSKSCETTCINEGFTGGGCMGFDEINYKFNLLAEAYGINDQISNPEREEFQYSNFPKRGKCGTDYTISCYCYEDELGVLDKT